MSRPIASIGAWGDALLVGLIVAGCSSSTPIAMDASTPRDGTVADSTIATDAAADAASADASAPGDAGAPCGAVCDPRLSTACGAAMACRFVDGEPSCVSMPAADGGALDAGTGDGGAWDAGAGAEGARCYDDTDCGGGLACFGDPTTGTCRRPCCPAADDCAASERCRGDGALAGGGVTAWGQCLPPQVCDLAHPACASREGCYIVDGAGATECRIAGAVAAGGACGGASDCAPGLVCAGLSTRTCLTICFLASTAPHQGCASTEHCEAQAYSPAGTGVCTAP